MKYTIDYGFGEATLYTPYAAKERFYALAGTCFGIRKSIMHCVILRAEEIPCEDFERLEFNGDVYVWREAVREKIMTRREQMMECAEAMEQGMLHTQTTRDMWQNDLIWWICKAAKLLLEERIRDNE